MIKYRILGLIGLCAVAAGVFSCGSGQGYTIKGQSDADGYAVLNIWIPEGESFRDTVVLDKGRFVFTGKVDDVRMGEVLVFNGGPVPQRTFLYVENARLVLRDGKFRGGPNNDFMLDMDKVSASLDTAASDYHKQLKKAMNECFAAHPDVEAAAFMYYIFNRETPLEQYEEGFGRFTSRVQESVLGKNAREEIAARKATMGGIPAPVFSLNGMDGNPVSLESLQGKYLLLDFWASWCRPCRESMPHLKEIYGRYHGKGLEILGVSIDSDALRWKQAVKEDATPWIHVIDETPVRNKPSRVASMYGVHAVPTVFLIAPDGKMIGKMRHDSLDVVIGRYLGE